MAIHFKFILASVKFDVALALTKQVRNLEFKTELNQRHLCDGKDL